MKHLYILCGAAFSGKTTLARTLCQATTCAYISLDEINAERGLYGGEGMDVEEWEQSHAIALQKMSDIMTEGRDIVLDDTCCFRRLRDRYRDCASEKGYSVQVVYLDTPTEEIHHRIAANSAHAQRRAIASDVLAEHLRTFEKPSVDESPIVLNSSQAISNWIGSLSSGTFGE